MKTNKVLRTIASLTLVLAMTVSVVLPYVSADAATEVKSIKITSSSKEVSVSKTLKLKTTLTPKKAKSKITWATSDKSIATVKNGTVTGKKAGTATITAKTANGKTATISIKVADAKVGPGSVIWKQEKEVVRKYDDYKYNVSAIWLCPYNLVYDGRNKDVGEAVDNKGRKLRFEGKFKMDGPDAKELLVQLNYTQPKAYPIVWQTKENQPVKSGKWYNVKFTFDIPKNAVNGDKDENGYNWPILLYFANKPNNTMIYKKGNDFTFKDFKITVVK